ncbi:MAG: sialate O-acetylesterase, partial [Akkermansiaceae bacterium]|nr:sialate O-acetylesterase [Akkermansiaceae bacterium]
VGFGAQKQTRDENNKRVTVPSIGPELGIGMVLGDRFEEPVLLVKAAWGGRAVKYSFRPPGAMPTDEQIRAEVAAIGKKREEQLERARRNPKKKPKPPGPEVTFESRKAGYGSDYRKVLSETRRVLDHIGNYIPAYDPKQGYEVAGFIWFQGWNDAIGAGNPHYVDQMAHFIRDMRRDLKVPALPFVIGELGTDGPGAEGWVATFRKQQAAIAALDEFKGSVRLAPTAAFWPATQPDLSKEWAAFRELARQNEQKPEDDPTRVDPGSFFHQNWLMNYKQRLS